MHIFFTQIHRPNHSVFAGVGFVVSVFFVFEGRPDNGKSQNGGSQAQAGQALNMMYMYEGVHLLLLAATEIQNSEILRQEDRTAVTVKSRDGILEQLDRMAVPDKL